MASTTMAVASSSAAVVAASVTECRSSSSPAFGSVRFAPVARRSGAVKANATIRASAQEEPKKVRQAMIGLLAAGAILVSGVPAFAASGPGADGAARTASKADQLLNSADELTKEDSPPTAKGSAQGKDAGSTARQAGSAASSNVQNIADAAVTNAKQNLAKAKEQFGDVIPKNKVSDASGLTNKTYTMSDASSAINDAQRSASNAVDDAKNALSSLGDKISGNAPSPGDVASDVKSKASDVTGKVPSPGDVASDVKSKAGDVKGKADDAARDAKGNLASTTRGLSGRQGMF